MLVKNSLKVEAKKRFVSPLHQSFSRAWHAIFPKKRSNKVEVENTYVECFPEIKKEKNRPTE